MSTLKVNNVTDLGDDAVITDGALVGAGKILQVVSTTLSTKVTVSSGAYQDVTGLSVTITPSSSSSKILVQVRLALASPVNNNGVFAQVLRDSTVIGGGDAVGVRQSAAFFARPATNLINHSPLAYIHLDEPNSTSALTYKVQAGGEASPVINTSTGNDSDNQFLPRLASTITVMEVAG